MHAPIALQAFGEIAPFLLVQGVAGKAGQTAGATFVRLVLAEAGWGRGERGAPRTPYGTAGMLWRRGKFLLEVTCQLGSLQT